MSNDGKQYTRELDEKFGRQYFIAYRAVPGWNDAAEFAVNVFYKEEGESTDIARIDMAHGGIHMDQLWLPGQPKDWDIDVDGIWEAGDILLENWERYAERHRLNHE